MWAAAGAVVVGLGCSSADAYEYGFLGLQQPNGLTHGSAGGAATPPLGLYAFIEPFAYEGHLTGAGAPIADGVNPSADVTGAAIGALYVPGWEIFGATYSAALFQPFFTATLGSPVNFTALGVHNTLIEPLARANVVSREHRFFAKLELGAYVPDGSISGPAGLSNIGTPWTMFIPTVTFSYMDPGYELSARFFQEINTANYKTGYQSGSVISVLRTEAPRPFAGGQNRRFEGRPRYAALRSASGPPSSACCWWLSWLLTAAEAFPISIRRGLSCSGTSRTRLIDSRPSSRLAPATLT